MTQPTLGTKYLNKSSQSSQRKAYRSLKRFTKNKIAFSALLLLILITVVALLAPIIAPHPFDKANFGATLQPPGTIGHLLGTDNLGRDVLTRMLFGIQSSLGVSVLAVAFSFIVGVPLGVIAGFSNALDTLISRATDVILAFPFIILAVGLTAIYGASLLNASIAIGIAFTPVMIRVARSETIRLKELDYVAAAIAAGAGNFNIMLRHIFPNAISALIIQSTLIFPMAILGEAMLSFLGLGIRPPTPSLGGMLSEAQSFSEVAPWLAVGPGLLIMCLVLAFNVVGDGLRDALDPKARKR